MRYTIYDKRTGEISRSIECSLEALGLNLRSFEGAIIGSFSRITHTVITVGEVALANLRDIPLRKPDPTYAELRFAAYPSLADQLDAVWKGGEAETAMRASVLAVKEKYPKPDGGAAGHADMAESNYNAMIRRRARALDLQGNPYEAMLLLKTIGE